MTQYVAQPSSSSLLVLTLQALVAFFTQNQTALAPVQNATSGSVSSSSSSTASSSPASGGGKFADRYRQSIFFIYAIRDHLRIDMIFLKTLRPFCVHRESPPSTPRTPANRQSKQPGSAAQTPSTKLAQMTLRGEKSTPPNKNRGRKTTARKTQSKGPVPTGYDPALTYEAAAPNRSPEDVKPSTNPQQEDSDPFEGFPEIVTVPPKADPSVDKMDVDPPKPSASRRKRTDPPPVKRSPKKKARVASPAHQAAPPKDASTASTATTSNPDHPLVAPPTEANRADIQLLEDLLNRARNGEKVNLGTLFNEPTAADLVDDEAEEQSAAADDENEDGDLDGFIVPDHVVEYDADAPSLPDDDDVPLSRLHRRSRVESEEPKDDSGSDIEIIPTSDKGKRRADPIPSPPASDGPMSGAAVNPASSSRRNEEASTSAAASVGSDHDSDDSTSSVVSWNNNARALSGLDRGLYPGSTPIDARASICSPIILDDQSVVFLWDAYRNGFLDAIDFCTDSKPVPGDCAVTLSDYNDDGWSTPSIEVIASVETHVHVSNLKRGLKFRRAGPFINEATVDPSELAAAQVSGPGSTLRYKLIVKDTRAPAVSITPCVVRYTRLATPSNGNPPLRYVSVSPFFGLFDRMMGMEGMLFGQRQLQCVSFNNAIRIATIPAFQRPVSSTTSSKAKTSSSIRRGNNSGQSSRRAFNFEPSTNDNVPVLDARAVKLPDDMSTWVSALPALDGPIPKDAVAFVAHTTNMWVGTRSKTAPSATTYNLQHNLLFIVVVGTLPAGLV
ncbi:hypothetical protein K525DRAFT_273417 [Schizophyllum commune Loenen D]|nr:hypothetical protein K525DRAFT_273417 [Schizophyllum commune Loenen D]